MELIKISVPEHRIVSALQRPGVRVVRQSSDLDSAVKAGGYLYSLHPGGRAVAASVCRSLMGKGLLVSAGDDLFADLDRGGADIRAPGILAAAEISEAEAR